MSLVKIEDMAPHRHLMMEISDVSKSFGGNWVLRNISAAARSGEVLALLGHNGAGKSTLIKIIAGVLDPDSGKVVINGQSLHADVRAAQAAGVAVIYQDLSLFPHISVSENIAGELGGKILYSPEDATEKAKHALSRLGFDELSRGFLETPVGELSVGMQQQIAIARALARDARILILDEPTASLAAKEAERLLEVVRGLAQRGAAIIFVSHRMGEVRAIADRFLVLRNGEISLQCAAGQRSDRELADALFGKTEQAANSTPAPRKEALPARSPHPAVNVAAPLLEVESCTRKGEFEDISFQLHPGEVTVLTGVVGSGRTEFAQALFGLRRLHRGSVRIAGQKLAPIRPQTAVAAGLAYLPENRQKEGLFLPFSVRTNLGSATLNRQARWGLLGRNPAIAELIRSFSIGCKGPNAPLWSLSGGNQQKVLFAKWMETTPKVIILDEPTTGVDIAAKSEIHRRIRALVQGGQAALVISSDLDEVVELADRVLIFRQGRLVLDRQRESANRQTIMQCMLGIVSCTDYFARGRVAPE
ncbi:MAG TPA: sugar ABC transporter ATP-binding protein [Candidatus Dormibacteraeota bacterium]|nr:sugar ABC transporter ATP-binding protein [Candidatus Dormibacteraeota bacterium]